VKENEFCAGFQSCWFTWQREGWLPAAKSAFTLPVNKMKIHVDEYIYHALQFCLKEWQDIWTSCQDNEFRAIYSNIGSMLHCEISPGMMQWSWIHHESVTLALHMCTCQSASFHSWLSTYLWIVRLFLKWSVIKHWAVFLLCWTMFCTDCRCGLHFAFILLFCESRKAPYCDRHTLRAVVWANKCKL